MRQASVPSLMAKRFDRLCSLISLSYEIHFYRDVFRWCSRRRHRTTAGLGRPRSPVQMATMSRERLHQNSISTNLDEIRAELRKSVVVNLSATLVMIRGGRPCPHK